MPSPAQPHAFIMFHAAVDDVVDRHLPYWRRYFGPDGFTLLCGWDQMPKTRHAAITQPCGRSEHHGPASIERMFEGLRIGVASGHEMLLMTEYDAVPFAPPPQGPIGDNFLLAPMQRNLEPKRFSAPLYPHPVFLISRWTCAALAADWPEHADIPKAEGYYGDRVIAALCGRIGITIVNDTRCFSVDHTRLNEPEQMAAAQTCLQRGGWCVHGVKTEHHLIALRDAAAAASPHP